MSNTGSQKNMHLNWLASMAECSKTIIINAMAAFKNQILQMLQLQDMWKAFLSNLQYKSIGKYSDWQDSMIYKYVRTYIDSLFVYQH